MPAIKKDTSHGRSTNAQMEATSQPPTDSADLRHPEMFENQQRQSPRKAFFTYARRQQVVD